MASSEDEGCDRFADLVSAKPDRAYRGHTVHFWTLPFSARPNRLTAENSTAKVVIRHFKRIYGATLAFYAVFKEFHGSSQRDWERKPHFHICLRLHRRVKWIRISKQVGHLCPFVCAHKVPVFLACYRLLLCAKLPQALI